MRIRSGTIFVVVIALAVGVAAGWFAAGAWREEKCLPAVALAKAGGNVETANDGRARSPVSPSRRLSAKRMLWQGCASLPGFCNFCVLYNLFHNLTYFWYNICIMETANEPYSIKTAREDGALFNSLLRHFVQSCDCEKPCDGGGDM